jgi:2-polyprenyl-3-methyl-5-hydroxy-6-metoxy-1,4-benzoquinol methylase
VGSDDNEWDQIYRKYPLNTLGWELGKPRPVLVEFVEKGFVKRGKALDLCCGAGTNTVYLAQNGFEVTGVDISPTALDYAKAKAKKANVAIDFSVENFVELPFRVKRSILFLIWAVFTTWSPRIGRGSFKVLVAC